MTTTMARTRRIVAALAAGMIVAGCAQVRRIGRSDDGDRGREEDAGRSRDEAGASSAEAGPDAPPRDKGQPAKHGRPPLPATPSSLVTEDAARQLKEELRNRGYLSKPSQGAELDAATSDALRQFQQEEGLAATGFPDQETLRRLNIDAGDAYRSDPEETKSSK